VLSTHAQAAPVRKTAAAAATAPPVISNDGWTGGMGNTSPAATPGQSFWALDYGSENGRWTIEEGAAWQSNAPIDSGGGINYGSRAFPASLDANYQASYGPGSGFDGLWQMDIRIGSTGSSGSTVAVSRLSTITTGSTNARCVRDSNRHGPKRGVRA